MSIASPRRPALRADGAGVRDWRAMQMGQGAEGDHVLTAIPLARRRLVVEWASLREPARIRMGKPPP